MYKFENAHDLLFKAYPDLPSEVMQILSSVDSDDIQDVCQNHMDDDGYFDEVDENGNPIPDDDEEGEEE